MNGKVTLGGKRRMNHEAGKTAETSNATLCFMRAADIYDQGSNLVVVRDSKAVTLDRDGLSYWLGNRIQYCAKGKKGKPQQIDPPPLMLKQVMAVGEARGLKKLDAVITTPVICPDGHTVERQGYDLASRLYFDVGDGRALPVPTCASIDDAEVALRFLMRPFAGFATATKVDRSVLLAALLTAIERAALPTAPAFGIDAPAQGTGKTYLATCIGALAIGAEPTVYPHTSGRDDEESRKRLTAVLANGERVLVWDNVLGMFNSQAIAAFLTSRVYSDRILGRSERIAIPNRVLVLITGNNLALAGDMPRRVLTCRLDAGVANPAMRKFDSDPLNYILCNRMALVQAGLTLIRAYLGSSARKAGGAVPRESTASFEAWDALVRQTVAWVAGEVARGDYCDPAEALKQAVNDDPDREALGDALEALQRATRGEWFTSNEIVKRIERAAPGKPYPDPSDVELRDSIDALQPGHVSHCTPRGLGRVLAFRRGRIANGLKLVKHTEGKRTTFRIDEVGASSEISAEAAAHIGEALETC